MRYVRSYKYPDLSTPREFASLRRGCGKADPHGLWWVLIAPPARYRASTGHATTRETFSVLCFDISSKRFIRLSHHLEPSEVRWRWASHGPAPDSHVRDRLIDTCHPWDGKLLVAPHPDALDDLDREDVGSAFLISLPLSAAEIRQQPISAQKPAAVLEMKRPSLHSYRLVADFVWREPRNPLGGIFSAARMFDNKVESIQGDEEFVASFRLGAGYSIRSL